MNPKPLSPLFLCVLFCLFISFSSFLVLPVNATVSYYNWLKNSSFEVNQNHIEDSGFESGGFGNCVEWGNWSGNAVVSTTTAHYGVYSCFIDKDHYLWWNFTDQILGYDVTGFTFYDKCIVGGQLYTLYICYSDSTNSSHVFTGTSGSWGLKNGLSYVNDAKYVVAFKLLCTQTYGVYVDDFIVSVYDYDAQTELTFTSTPWYCGGDATENFVGLTSGSGHTGSCSVYMGYDEWWAGFYQDIDYLDSDWVHFVDMWVLAGASVGVTVNLIYSDRSYTTRMVNVTQSGSWQQVLFSGFFADDKYIIQIQVFLANYIPAYFNFDDVGLWASEPVDTVKFSFAVAPLPVVQTSLSFSVYQGVSHVLTCFVYDDNGSCTESGNWRISDIYGLHQGNFTDGTFSMTLAIRNGVEDIEEQIVVTVILSDEVVIVSITAHWYYVAGTTDETEGWYGVPDYVNFIVLFLVVGLPAVVLGSAGAKSGWGLQGLLFGALLGVGCGVCVGLIPFWFVFVMSLFLVIFLYSLAKKA